MKLFPVLLILLAALSPLSASAESRYIDSIVAIVEDDVITNSELRVEVKRIRDELSASGRQIPGEASLNRQVLELIINKSILVQRAKNAGITITDTQLNNTLTTMAKRNNMSLEQFRQALIRTDVDYPEFREGIRDQIAISQLKRRYAMSNAEISDQEVDDFLTRNQNSNAEYRLSHILIALPDGASSDQVSQARKRIDQLKSEIEAGADFAQLASEHSDGGTALQGGDLGWRKLAAIPSLFAEQAPLMRVGETSEVLRSASGFHLVQLDEKRDGEKVFTEQTLARHILVKPDEITTLTQAREQLEGVRERILGGEDFAAMARQYSDDPGSGGLGGDLGWFAKGKMVDEFQEVVDATAINDISPVFQSPYGWHIVQVLDRRTVDETDESRRNKIRSQLQEQKEQEVLELWQRRLRDEAYVKIIGS